MKHIKEWKEEGGSIIDNYQKLPKLIQGQSRWRLGSIENYRRLSKHIQGWREEGGSIIENYRSSFKDGGGRERSINKTYHKLSKPI